MILGQVLTAGAGQNPARQAAIKAGLPYSVPALTLNKVCGSGLKALHLAAQAIRCGDAEVVIAGGQENMSLAPYVLPSARTGQRMGHGQLVDTMITDGLWDAFNDYHMGITAENRWKNTASPASSRTPLPPSPSARRWPPSRRAASRMRSPRSPCRRKRRAAGVRHRRATAPRHHRRSPG